MALFKRLVAVCAVFLAGSVVHAAPTDNPINPGFPYGSQKVRGVNLGGWLVLEVCSFPSRVFRAIVRAFDAHQGFEHITCPADALLVLLGSLGLRQVSSTTLATQTSSMNGRLGNFKIAARLPIPSRITGTPGSPSLISLPSLLQGT